MIRLTITGNLGRDAEVRTLQSGDTAISFTVCHTEKYKGKDGNTHETAHWVTCTKWLKAGSNTAIANYLKKGQKVLVEGTPSARGYMLDGSTEVKSSLECRVTNIELLGSAPASGATNQAPAAQATNMTATDWSKPVDDDLPF